MSNSNSSKATTSTDWTGLLSDPDLGEHLGELLRTYRETPAGKREEALLAAMRDIKTRAGGVSAVATDGEQPCTPKPVPVAATAAPPFDPDVFTPTWAQDRRKHPRLKCYVAVELRVAASGAPIWGNLSNTSLGGCYIETASPVSTGENVEVGLWVASGKIWVKGIVLTGIVTQSNPSFGIRVRFSDLQPPERQTLRQFLKFVESTTQGYQVENGYLAQLKR